MAQCLTALVLVLLMATSAAYISVPFNTTHYFGPDGPWQGVMVKIGYPVVNSSSESVTLLPAWYGDIVGPAVWIPNTQACDRYPYTSCGIGGVISPPPRSIRWNETWGNSYYALNGWILNCSGPGAMADILLMTGRQMNSANVGIAKLSTITYPNGIVTGTELGLFNLGGEDIFTPNSPPKWGYENGFIQSNSFAMHIGVAGIGYPGSLIFGGYDRGRVLGPVISFNARGDSILELLDIIIETEIGDSPFNFKQQANLLLHGNRTVSEPLATQITPQFRYILLPQAAIDAITSKLPVRFESGFYIWNTEDPAYSKIITSSAYLGFTFASAGISDALNVTIKVPFMLLNLTLTPTLSGLYSEVQYLPILNGGNPANWDNYKVVLGRAFLQAAFFGANWGKKLFWLAQAPGPGSDNEGLGYDPRELAAATTTLDVESDLMGSFFKGSWSDHWTVLKSEHSQTNDTPSQANGTAILDSKGGNNDALIAEIVVPVVIGVAIVAGIIWFVLRRKRRTFTAGAAATADDDYKPANTVGCSVEAAELDASRRLELESKDRPGELSTNVESWELPHKND